MSPKAKLATLIFIALGILVLAFSAFANRDILFESYWIRRLESDDALARQAAIRKLAAMGSARAIPGLLEMLREAARADLLEDPELDTSLCAEALIGIIEKRRAAAELAILAALAADDDGSAAPALAALRGPGEPFLSRSLSSWNPKVRACAAEALSLMGPAAEPSVPFLERQFREDGDAQVRIAIARALASISPATGEDCCIQLLGSEVPEEKERAARLLGELRSAKAVPHLLRALRNAPGSDKDSKRFPEAISAISEIGDQALLPLIDELEQGDPEVRRLAMEMLANLNGDILPAISKIRSALGSGDESLRFWALACLKRLGPDSLAALPEIIGALGDSSPNLRRSAMKVLGAIGPGASQALPRLVEILETDADHFRESAESICAIEGESRTAIPILLRWFKEGDPVSSSKAYRALEEIGFKTRSGIPGLIPALRHRSTSVRMEAVRCLSELWPADPRRIIPALAAALEDADSGVRLYTLETLAIIGPEARPALPALQRALDHEDEATRKAAAAAICKLAGGRR